LLLAAAAAALVAGGWKLWELRRHRQALLEIKQEIHAGRHGHALRKLATLTAWKGDSDEAAYLRGVCERARGGAQAACQAWERVSPGSPFAARALRGRMELLIERGRLADAEALITEAMADPRFDASGLRLSLGMVYSIQGRLEEGERLLEACWDRLDAAGEGASALAIRLVRLHIELWRETPSVEASRSFLDQVTRTAPNDDRGWLGKAKLAIRAGAFDEAERWLAACLRRRPDDIAVWRARLDWALATHHLAEVRTALSHLPVEESTPAQVQRLTAWLAARSGDIACERRALEGLLAADPADFAAIDRLAAIAEKARDADRAGELRRNKSELERLQARYIQLDARNQTIRDAVELAGLAERLGRRFEAKVFLTIAAATEPENRQLLQQSLERSQEAGPFQSPGRRLGDLLAAPLDAAERASRGSRSRSK
jgi:predicted Zn-dependent protease